MTGIYRLSHKTCNEGKNKYNKIYRRKKLKYRVKIWRKTAFWVLSWNTGPLNYGTWMNLEESLKVLCNSAADL